MSRSSLTFPLSILLLSVPAIFAHAAHYPDPVPTSEVMTFTATVTVEGGVLSAGDEVVAYSVHPVPGAAGKWERTVVGHHVVVPGGQTVTLSLYGDDNTTPGVVEGAVPGEEVVLLLWRASEGKEYAAYRSPAGGPVSVTWSPGILPVVLDIDFTSGERIPLRSGAWNLFSYGVLHGYQAQNRPPPTAPQLPGVSWDNVATLGDSFPLRSIAGKYDRVLGNDGTGATFWNPLLPSISTLSYLAPGYGYWVKMKPSPDALSWLTVPGPRTIGSESLSLNAGWTLTGYWGWPVYHAGSYFPWDGLYPADVYDNVALPSIGDLWSSLGSDYVRVTSFDGFGAHLWNPSLPQTRTLHYMGPGYGYWVKMARPGTLSYPLPPVPPTVATLPASGLGTDNAVLHGTANPEGSASEAWFEWGSDPLLGSYDNTARQAVGSGSAVVPFTATVPGLTPGATYYYRAAASNAGGTRKGSVVSFATATPGLPPDPGTVAPPVTLTSPTTVYESTRFLYEGASPIQTGVSPGTIDSRRAAVLRGKVTTREGSPLPGVRVTVLGHPEYGQTLSRADGWFDLAANGGGYLTVSYDRAGYLPAQRQVDVPWREYAILPDVALVTPDPQATVIDLTSSSPIQVARGSVVTDGDGTRRATLLFSQGTTATMVMPDNTAVPLTSLTVRATEYTVGANGPRSMPAELPPTSGYTYAVELSADEAVAAGAETVRFDRPVYQYVENFLGFPVGMVVPAGYYDRKLGSWLPSQNGRVVRVLSVDNGMATLDTDGDGAGDNAARLASLNVTDSERVQLASLYPAGTSLWRVPIPHFSQWDYNWPYAPPLDAVPPNPPPPPPPGPPNPNCRGGSLIICQNQTLIESVGVTGTPFTLNYASDRVAGRKDNYSVRIPVGGSALPASLRKIALTVYVAGRKFDYELPPDPKQAVDFTWDGRDAYGNVVQGPQTAYIRVEYEYPMVYYASSEFENAFSRLGTVPIERVRRTMGLTMDWRSTTTLGAWQSPPNGLGGWTLDVHHAYDPVGRTLFPGDGTRRSSRAEMAPDMLRTVLGGGNTGISDPSAQGKPAVEISVPETFGIAVGPDGTMYAMFFGSSGISRVAPDGTYAFLQPLGQAVFDTGKIAVDSIGNLFITNYDQGSQTGSQVLKIGSDNGASVVAGGGNRPVCNIQQDTSILCDRFPAVEARLPYLLEDVAVTPDGTLYVADAENIYKISVDGFIEFVAGGPTGAWGPRGIFMNLSTIKALDVGPDGSVYVAHFEFTPPPRVPYMQVTRIRPSGRVEKFAGAYPGYLGDGGPADQARLSDIRDIAVAKDGTVYIADTSDFRVRKVTPDGMIDTVAGNRLSMCPLPPPSVRAAKEPICSNFAVAVAPDGRLYLGDYKVLAVLETPFSGGTGGEVRIASADGGEVYYFDGTGRHLRTVHALTGAVLREFAYDPQGRLIRITDGDGNVTTVERDGSGNPTAILAPFGQRTVLTIDPDGLLSAVANPAGDTHRMAYIPGALLSSFADPRGNASTFRYDGMGRLVRDDDAAGGFQSLLRTGNPGNFEVSVTTALGRATTYAGEDLPTGTHRKVVTDPIGGRTETLLSPDGGLETRRPDGTVTVMKKGADPRFGIEAPVVLSSTTRTPGGLERAVSTQRSVILAAPGDPFSLINQADNVTINGRSYLTTYDNATRTFTSTSPAGRGATATIDARGRVLSKRSDLSLDPVEYSYNSRGLPIRMSSGDQVRIMDYDPLGRLATSTDNGGNTRAFGYDNADRVSRLTLPSGREYRFSYDPNGNMAQVVMPSGAIHALDYTTVNFDNGYTPPGNAPYRWSYDLDRARVRTTFPSGKTLDASRDAGGRPTGWAYPEAQVTLGYAPGDNTSRISRILRTPIGGGATQENTLEYDGRLLTALSFSGASNGQFRYVYDNNFFLTAMSLTSGPDHVSIPLARDGDGLTTRYGPFSLTRGGPAGRVSQVTDGVLDVSITYDSLGRTSSRTHTVDGLPVYRLQVTYDNVGRIVRRDETSGGTARVYEYSYDVDGQLTGVKRDGAIFETYGYDANGNRTLRQDGTAPPVTAAYDNQDRLTQQGSIVYQHDADGYLVGRGNDSFRYSVRGELLEATVEGVNVTYAYDGLGRRVARTDGSGTTQYLYGNLSTPFQLTATRDPSGELTFYYYVLNRLFAFDRGMSRYYVGADYVGTPRVVTDNTGTAVRVMDTDSFGNVLSDSDPAFPLPMGFAGGLYDPITNMVRFGYREYDSSTGRWNSKDPILFLGGNTNLYVYTFNDPVNFIDPTGKVDENPPPGAERADFGNGNYDEAIVTDSPNHPGVSKNILSGPVHISRQCQSGKCSYNVWDPKTKFSVGCAADVEGTNLSDSEANKNAQTIVDTDNFGTSDVTVSLGQPTIWYVNPNSVDFTNELGF